MSNSLRATSCTTCAVGKVTTSAGQASCEACGDMSIPNESQTACIACGDNQVPDPQTKTSCLEWGADGEAQKGVCVKLTKCSPGEYSGTGFHPCQSCEAGYSNQLSGATVCTACEQGKVAVGAGLALCSSCAPNSVAEEGAFQCTECDSSKNEEPDKHQGACVESSDNENASNGENKE